MQLQLYSNDDMEANPTAKSKLLKGECNNAPWKLSYVVQNNISCQRIIPSFILIFHVFSMQMIKILSKSSLIQLNFENFSNVLYHYYITAQVVIINES